MNGVKSPTRYAGPMTLAGRDLKRGRNEVSSDELKVLIDIAQFVVGSGCGGGQMARVLY